MQKMGEGRYTPGHVNYLGGPRSYGKVKMKCSNCHSRDTRVVWGIDEDNVLIQCNECKDVEVRGLEGEVRFSHAAELV